MSERVAGIVKWFDRQKGFGIIACEDGSDVLVHYTAVVGQDTRTLTEGERVEFTMTVGSKGPQANEVVRLSTV